MEWAGGSGRAIVAALERGLDETDAFELDARLRRAVRFEASLLVRVAELLVPVAADKLYRNRGFRSLDAYAEERLGMSASRARVMLRVGRAAAVCSALRRAFASGRLSWVEAHTLVPLLLEDGSVAHGRGWVEHAARVSVRKLEDEVESAVAAGVFDVRLAAVSRRSAPRVCKRVRGHALRKESGVSSSSRRSTWRIRFARGGRR